MSPFKHVLAVLALAAFIMVARLGSRPLRVWYRSSSQGCVRQREIRYCVTAWNRDWYNVNGRAAIGEAAQAWNRATPYRFREVYCNDPHDLPIFFEYGEHADGHAAAPWPENQLAHATFPSSSYQFIHVRNDIPWQQASDTPGQGYDLRSVMLHEMGHVLGLEHDLGGDSVMTPYEPRHNPLWSDVETVRANAERCRIEPPPALDVDLPAPGTTWRIGRTYTMAWRSELEGHVRVEVWRLGRHFWTPWEAAPPSGRYDFVIGGDWPVGPGYEVCVSHPTAGRFCSNMALVAP